MDGARIADGLGMRRGGKVNRHTRVFGLDNRMAKVVLTETGKQWMHKVGARSVVGCEAGDEF